MFFHKPLNAEATACNVGLAPPPAKGDLRQGHPGRQELGVRFHDKDMIEAHTAHEGIFEEHDKNMNHDSDVLAHSERVVAEIVAQM